MRRVLLGILFAAFSITGAGAQKDISLANVPSTAVTTAPYEPPPPLSGSAKLPPRDYTLRVISDDGVRVWVDGELVLDDWEPHASKVDTVRVKGGERRFKVQYYEVGGFAELRFDIQRR